MSIVLTRIDNRLIHGQVIETWVPHIQADAILVVNDEVAGQALKKALMEMSVPSSIRVQIVRVADAAAILANGSFEADRVLLLFASTADALRAYRLGLVFDRLNLGNLHGGEGKTRYSCTICLDQGDLDNLQQLEAAGVEVIAQCVPSDRVQPLARLRTCSARLA